jgi:replicative DNA helicase
MSEIYSPELERAVLSGLMKHPKALAELDTFLSASHFVNNGHRNIFTIIRETIYAGEDPEPVLLSSKLKNVGLVIGENIEPYDFIESISLIRSSHKNTIISGKKLVYLQKRRDVKEIAKQLSEIALDEKTTKLTDLLAHCDKAYGKLNIVEVDKSNDLFLDLYEELINRGKNPVERIGLKLPYPILEDYFGALRAENVYSICARPKTGKTTFMNDFSMKMAIENPNTKVLLLDTEMCTADIRYRMASAITGIPMFDLETGQFSRVEEYVRKLKANKEKIRNMVGLCTHKHVADMNIDQVVTFVKQWNLHNCTREANKIIVYDYLKITGDESNNKQEYQIIGDKVNKLKKVAEAIKCPVLAPCQLNREAENGVDDSRSIAQSDRISWFAGFVALLTKKTKEEMAEEGEKFGTHKLKPIFTRYGGRKLKHWFDYIKDQNGKYVRNFINFRVDDFNVKEISTAEDMYDSMKDNQELEEYQ